MIKKNRCIILMASSTNGQRVDNEFNDCEDDNITNIKVTPHKQL